MIGVSFRWRAIKKKWELTQCYSLPSINFPPFMSAFVCSVMPSFQSILTIHESIVGISPTPHILFVTPKSICTAKQEEVWVGHIHSLLRSNKQAMMLCLLVWAFIQWWPDAGDGGGQCSIVQESPVWGQLDRIWYPLLALISGAASDKSHITSEPCSLFCKTKKIESTRMNFFF